MIDRFYCTVQNLPGIANGGRVGAFGRTGGFSGPNGQNDGIRFTVLNHRLCNLCIRFNRHAFFYALCRKGFNIPFVYFFVRGFCGVKDISTGFFFLLEKDNLVPQSSGLVSGRETARSTTYNPDPAADGSRPFGVKEFLSGLRVDCTTDRKLLQRQAFNASLVAGKAFEGIFGMAFPDIFQKIGVGKMLARHGDHIRIATCNDFIHYIRINIPSDGNDGNIRHILDFAGQIRLEARSVFNRRAGIRSINVHFGTAVRAERHIDDICACSNQIGDDGLDVGNRVTVFDALFSGYADGYGKIITNLAACFPKTFDHKTGPPAEVASILIRAMVTVGGKKLHEQVTMRSVKLDGVEPCFPCPPCA